MDEVEHAAHGGQGALGWLANGSVPARRWVTWPPPQQQKQERLLRYGGGRPPPPALKTLQPDGSQSRRPVVEARCGSSGDDDGGWQKPPCPLSFPDLQPRVVVASAAGVRWRVQEAREARPKTLLASASQEETVEICIAGGAGPRTTTSSPGLVEMQVVQKCPVTNPAGERKRGHHGVAQNCMSSPPLSASVTQTDRAACLDTESRDWVPGHPGCFDWQKNSRAAWSHKG